jgi:8-oxo-dGTP pyrophosphatase MutT (NUDIX family)
VTAELPLWWTPLRDRIGTLRAEDFHRSAVPRGGGRQGAVLVLLGDGLPTNPNPDPFIVVIERSASLRDHAGQSAFPGGGAEPGDNGPVGTALREASEEIGLRPDSVQVVATLPELWLQVSRFVVTPVLAWWREPHPVLAADPGEVARVARLPVAELADPANRFLVRHSSGFVGPAFRVRDMLVWGFTGGIVAKLLDLAGWSQPWDRGRIEDLPPGA